MTSSRDGVFSYMHLDNPNKVLYMERWKEEPIPFDDIETQNLVEAVSSIYPQLFLDEEEEDETLYTQSSNFGAKALKNRHLKVKAWSDLRLYETFLDESGELNVIRDKTIIPPIACPDIMADEIAGLSLADFLSNGYNIPPINMADAGSPGNLSDSIMGFHHADLTANSISDFGANNTFLNMRCSSLNNANMNIEEQSQAPPLETPRSGRVRQMSDKNFQTPISRIMR